MNNVLHLLIAGKHAGLVSQSENGSLSFSYDVDYAGIPLSLSMPVRNVEYGDKVVRPFLFGLLPDDEAMRRKIGREFGVSGGNPFALLNCIGLDCPGAVQICSDSALAGMAKREERLVPISEKDIATRLRAGVAPSTQTWIAANERWSLAGAQSKFALRREDGLWFSCEGDAATTHILKPSAHGLKHEALNEYLCLKIAERCRIPVSAAHYEEFEGAGAIVLERYDRARASDGRVVRLHQEDMCQALSVSPDKKYPEDGGPGASRVVGLLKKTGSAARQNIGSFLKMLFFNYLITAPDAHAKNYSLLLGARQTYLAPMYDVATILPYTERPYDVKLAMGLAGENRVCKIGLQRISKFAEANGLDEVGIGQEDLLAILGGLASRIPNVAQEVFEENSKIDGAEQLAERVMPVLEQICERSLARIS